MPEHARIKRHALSGVRWIGLSTLVTSAFQYAQVAFLTHFLSPYDFGLMAMAYAAYAIGQSAGLGNVALLAIMAIVSIITFMAIALAFNREYLRELWQPVAPGPAGRDPGASR